MTLTLAIACALSTSMSLGAGGAALVENAKNVGASSATAAASSRAASAGGGSIAIVQVCSTSGPVAIPDNDPTGASMSINVPATAGVIRDLNLSITISHTCVADLEIAIFSPNPSAAVVIDSFASGGIFDGLGCPENFTLTILDDEAPTSLRDGVAPFTGQFNTAWPNASPLSFFDGGNPTGEWTLFVLDEAGADSGQIISWCLTMAVETCPGDLNGDGLVNSADLASLLGAWGACQ